MTESDRGEVSGGRVPLFCAFRAAVRSNRRRRDRFQMGGRGAGEKIESAVSRRSVNRDDGRVLRGAMLQFEGSSALSNEYLPWRWNTSREVF